MDRASSRRRAGPRPVSLRRRFPGLGCLPLAAPRPVPRSHQRTVHTSGGRGATRGWHQAPWRPAYFALDWRGARKYVLRPDIAFWHRGTL